MAPATPRRPGYAGPPLQFAASFLTSAFQRIFSTSGCRRHAGAISENLRQDPAALVAFIAAQRVERLFLPFTSLQNVAEAAQRADATLPALRTVITAGEQLRLNAAIRWLFASPQRRAAQPLWADRNACGVDAYVGRRPGDVANAHRRLVARLPIHKSTFWIVAASRRRSG